MSDTHCSEWSSQKNLLSYVGKRFSGCCGGYFGDDWGEKEIVAIGETWITVRVSWLDTSMGDKVEDWERKYYCRTANFDSAGQMIECLEKWMSEKNDY